MATIKGLYRLDGRQCQGLIESIFELIGLDLPVQDHSTLSRCIGKLFIELPVIPKNSARHVVLDSTGVKVYCEGKWNTCQHGVSKCWTWRKLHFRIDESNREILAAIVTTNNVTDCEVLEDLLDLIPDALDQVSADGADDTSDCYEAITTRQARAIIPPRKGAKIWRHGICKDTRHDRDQNLRACRQKGRKGWKCESNYHRCSLAETGMFRLKMLFEGTMLSRTFENPAVEIFIKCAVLHWMSQLCKADSYKVEA